MNATQLSRRGPALVLLDEDCFPIEPVILGDEPTGLPITTETSGDAPKKETER